MVVSPTYVPDLVHACLDLAIDGEAGIWHLSNAGGVSWAELALMSAQAAGIDASRLEAKPASSCGFVAARPGYTAMTSERGILLPALDNALARYLELRNQEDPEMEELIRSMETRQPLAGEQRQMEETPVEAFQAQRS
jgi:dTDP-4-dehydrorhamnose reductase